MVNGAIRTLTKVGVFAGKLTCIVDATGLEITVEYDGCGRVARKRKITDRCGKLHEIEVTVRDGKVIILIAARTKVTLTAKVIPI